jgi:hypothetical protein
MRFKDHSVTQVLVGLHRIGIVGLHEALRTAEEGGLEGRDTVVDWVMDHLERHNYLPDRLLEAFRTAVWREYLRHRGEDFSEFYSEVPVTVSGEPGEELDRFVDLVRSVLAELELRPVVAVAPAIGGGPNPRLEIGEATIVQGMPSYGVLKQAVRQSLSDW